MKRLAVIFIALFLAILLAFILLKPVIIILAQNQLKGIFVGSAVSIGGCDFKQLNQLRLRDIEIKDGRAYEIKIRQALVQCGMLAKIKLHIEDAWVKVNLGPNNISSIQPSLNLNVSPGSRSALLLEDLAISGLDLDISAADLKLKAVMSWESDLEKRTLNYCDAYIDNLESRGLQLSRATVRFERGAQSGELYIKEIKFDRVGAREIKARFRLEYAILSLDPLFAESIGGEIRGVLSLNLDKNLEYAGSLKFINLDIDSLVNDFNLQEKFLMSGKLSGVAALGGKGPGLDSLQGDFIIGEPGGRLTITDANLLKNMANSSGQSLDILVESFKDYRYNTGIIKLYLDRGDIILESVLNGEAGKRDLKVVLHGFKLGTL
jgi:hypothetical protein